VALESVGSNPSTHPSEISVAGEPLIIAGGGKVATSDRELKGLIEEHEAIRAQLRQLTDSLPRSFSKLSPGSSKNEVKDFILGCQFALHDLRDGIRLHIDSDERIFKAFSLGALSESLQREHEEIKRQIDRAVQLADTPVKDVADREELNRRCSEINRAAGIVRTLVETHTAKEDTLLDLARKDR
jgi:hypothetical protein